VWLELLKAVARQQLAAGQEEFDLGIGGSVPRPGLGRVAPDATARGGAPPPITSSGWGTRP
jgi:hypothetical protein